jgi:hypothetical protein
MSVIKASPVLSEGAEVATTPVNNETITAITDWRDTTVIHKETEDGLDRQCDFTERGGREPCRTCGTIGDRFRTFGRFTPPIVLWPPLVSLATITKAATARLRPNIERKRPACEMHQQPV